MKVINTEKKEMKKVTKITLSLLTCLILACATTTDQTIGNSSKIEALPKLVVVIVIDQMQYDYLERFGPLFEHGLKQFWTEGTVFTNAHHFHIPTNTAPGHATLSTGTHPARHGIISNSYYDKKNRSSNYCVGDSNVTILGVEHLGNLPGQSADNLLVTTLGDWLKEANSKSKVCSVSKKDRSAILMGGKNPDYALWLDELSTRFVTSDYYPKGHPGWAKRFVGTEEMKDFLVKGWRKKASEEVYSLSREDDYPLEMGVFIPTFPHTKDRMATGLPESRKNSIMLVSTPQADQMVLDFSFLTLEKAKLGNDQHTDILFVGCSAADAIGHHFGPYSQEVQDYYLWLDEFLGEFFEKIDDKIGKDQYWAVLSADHGVAPFPEEMQRRGKDAKRILYSDFYRDVNEKIQALIVEYGLREMLLLDRSGGLYFDYDELEEKGVTRREFNEKVCQSLESLEYVKKAFYREQLLSNEEIEEIQPFRNSFNPERSPDVVIHFKEYYLIHGRTGTNHGSAYPYDMHVPLIFLGEPFQPGKIERRVETVDVAPTLAELLHVPYPKSIDGKVIKEVIK